MLELINVAGINNMDAELMIPLLAIFMGCSIAIIAIISGAIRRSIQAKHFEESRREIAAYIAEGSITAEEGQRLLKTSPKHLSSDD